MNDHDKKVTAYHEAGHAVVAASLHHTDPVNKVTILPRGRALGYTMVMPQEDRYSKSRNQLLDALAYAMGGRIAEEMLFGDPSTGASNDIAEASKTAREMVTQFGMSATIGSVHLTSETGEVFLGRDLGHGRDFSEQMAARIDAEIKVLMDGAMREAGAALVLNRKVLDVLADELLEKETILQDRLDEVFTSIKKVPKRKPWSSGFVDIGGKQ
jgi:cell division protease FtsH